MSKLDRLVVSIATRGRAERLMETVKRNVGNITLPNTVIFLGVDSDDPPTIDAGKKLFKEFKEHIHLSVAPREDTIAQKWNRALRIDATCYSALGDDDPIATYGFDAKLIEAAER